ncbi:hypothetical protein RZM92_000856 [Citrobacter freundii]|nr:hypothetical protein [Citrobacter freundii]
MIRTEALRALIKEIDDDFCRESVPIPQRTMRCMAILSQKLQVNLPIYASKEKSYMSEGHRISYVISAWYDEMYGNRKNKNIDIGYVLLLVRGDLMVCRIPNFMGECCFLIEEDLSVKMAPNETNILLMMDGMTQAFSSSLSYQEKEEIFNQFKKGLNASVIISEWLGSDLDMIKAAVNDLKIIESNIKSNFRHLGNAKWSYNQFVEKILKSWLLKAGLERSCLKNYSHNLAAAAKKFNEYYHEKIDLSLLDGIKGGAGLRYDEIGVDECELIQVQNDVFEVVNLIGGCPKLQ